MSDAEKIARALTCWSGEPTLQRLDGGISNENFLVTDSAGKYVARINGDVPAHGVLRDNDFLCNRAAATVGVAPRVHHFEPGALVVDYIESRTLGDEDVRRDDQLAKILDLIKRTHTDAYHQTAKPILAFWPSQICRSYGLALLEKGSSWSAKITEMMQVNDRLEVLVGPSTMVLGHNDMLAANLLDDGERLWLIDWEYSGLSNPLFDLANLASNNGLSRDQEDWLLTSYFGREIDETLLNRFDAMKCISLMREALWSMTSEISSSLDVNFAAYTTENLEKYYAALNESGFSL